MCQFEYDEWQMEALESQMEGKMEATIGDYIIKGVKGEFYPCKPDIFHISYELVE
jgi:hypothetical protein